MERCSRSHIQLGCAPRLDRPYWVHKLDRLPPSLRWRSDMDTRLRQHICPPGVHLLSNEVDMPHCKLNPHQDKADDICAGIHSTALLFGDRTRPILSGLSLSSLSLLSYAGYINVQGMPFFAGVGLAGVQLARVLYRTDFDDRSSCWGGFVGCGWAGFWVWMGALVDYMAL
jgi:hypothetical protein